MRFKCGTEVRGFYDIWLAYEFVLDPVVLKSPRSKSLALSFAVTI
jgi:hypothetical protein